MSKTEGQSSVAAAGPARVGPRTKDLTKRLVPGDIAVINHVDLDRVAADALIEAGPAAVINAAESISGRYPNGGPIRLARAGIPLLDQVGEEIMVDLPDDSHIRIEADGTVWNGEAVAKGDLLTVDAIESRMEAARGAIGSELEQFAINTLAFIEDEAHLIFVYLNRIS